MSTMQKTTRLFAILALVVILAACSSPTAVVQPTPDVPQIRTESAQTVVAKLTIAAALQPTATAAATQAPTEVPATATAAPSPTLINTPVPTLTPIATSRPPSGGPAYPTATRRSGPDQAQFISQEPTDGTVLKPGEDFDARWTFKNIGTSTWSTDFDYRFADGTNMSPVTSYALPEAVAPGESITVVADMTAPSSAGRYVSYWELINSNGDVFFQFYMVIDVK